MVSLVIPTYNERPNMAPLLARTQAALAATGEEFEVIVVDDSSPDGTAAEVRRLQQDNRPWLRLICRPRDLSTAVITGWRQARGELLACMDADFQHPPEALTNLVWRQRQTGADLVIASRYAGRACTRAATARRWLTRATSALASALLPGVLTGLSDPMSGFFLFRRAAAPLDRLRPRGYKLLIEILARCRPAQIAEVPFAFARREAGRSKAGPAVAVHFFRQVLALAAATGELRKMARFGVVGLTGVAVNYAAFAALRHAGAALAPAAALACAASIINNFTGNEFFTFRAAAQAAPGVRAVTRRLARFFAFSLVGLGLDTAAVAALTPLLGWALALAVGIGLASGWNFIANATMTWPQPAPRCAVLAPSCPRPVPPLPIRSLAPHIGEYVPPAEPLAAASR